MDEQARQQIVDNEHLKVLRIGYFVMAGLSVFGALFGRLYAGIGTTVGIAGAHLPRRSGDPGPAFIGCLFGALGCFFVVYFGIYAILAFLTAGALGRRRSRMLCLITAGLSCLHMPVGTLLGVFTFIVLGRPSVMATFENGTPAGPPGGYGPPAPPPYPPQE